MTKREHSLSPSSDNLTLQFANMKLLTLLQVLSTPQVSSWTQPPVLEAQKKCNFPCLSDIQVSKKCNLQTPIQAKQAWELGRGRAGD